MGLGLAIIRRLAALLDHEVEFDSASGRGVAILYPGPTGNAG